jgi:hypothetical protein
MKPLKFEVQGRAEFPYEVVARRKGDNLTMTCDCSAADYGRHCKHRLNLLTGDVTNLVSGNEKDVEKLAEMVKGTDVELALADYFAAEQAFEQAKKHLNGTKFAIARKLAD